MLKQLLDDELRRYRAFRLQAEAERWQGKAANEARMSYTNRYQQAFTAIEAPETTALMVGYLRDEHFGETAALVLKVQWIHRNEPKDDSRFLGGVDFSRVEEKRTERSRHPTTTCNEAEAIFQAIAPLNAENATPAEKNHAIRLAGQAMRLPHGERADTIKTLFATAPQRARSNLVLNLILSGETIPFSVVQAGIDDVLEEAKKQTWILDEGWQLKAWLRLLPLTDHPAQLADTIAALPRRQREPHFLEEMISASESAQTPEVEEALFKLAENDAAFYANHAWRDAVRRRGTPSAARRYFDLVMAGKIDARDVWDTSQEIAGLLNADSGLRKHAYDLLKDGTSSKITLLARAVAEGGDPDGLLLLVQLENRLQRSLISWRTIEAAITKQIPSEQWRGAVEVQSVAATELRKNLLDMTTDGGPYDAAARVLREIDRIRDENGGPEDEPRHPDLASGKPWPILAPDPDLRGTVGS
jgi:NACHT conflict system protein